MICCLAIFASLLFEYYYPIRPEYPKIFRAKSGAVKTIEELRQLEKPDDKLKMYNLHEVSKHSGLKGTAAAWVVCKGVIYDVSSNNVYKSDGGYNCFAGKDATIALGKMSFEKVGERGWQSKLSHDELAVVDEWVKWYEQRYKKVGYLTEDYAGCDKKEQ